MSIQYVFEDEKPDRRPSYVFEDTEPAPKPAPKRPAPAPAAPTAVLEPGVPGAVPMTREEELRREAARKREELARRQARIEKQFAPRARPFSAGTMVRVGEEMQRQFRTGVEEVKRGVKQVREAPSGREAIERLIRGEEFPTALRGIGTTALGAARVVGSPATAWKERFLPELVQVARNKGVPEPLLIAMDTMLGSVIDVEIDPTNIVAGSPAVLVTKNLVMRRALQNAARIGARRALLEAAQDVARTEGGDAAEVAGRVAQRLSGEATLPTTARPAVAAAAPPAQPAVRAAEAAIPPAAPAAEAAVQPRLPPSPPPTKRGPELLRQVETRLKDQPVSAVDVQQYISSTFTPVSVGRMPFYYKRGAKVLGMFFGKEENIRVIDQLDLDTVSHELGHYLDKTFGVRQVEGMDDLQALFNIGPQYNAGEVPAELVAEGINFWMKDRDTILELAPRWVKAFEARVKQNPAVWSQLESARRATTAWFEQSPQARILGRIATPQRPEQRFLSRWDKIITRWEEELHPLNKVVDVLTGGRRPLAEGDPFKLAYRLRGGMGRVAAWIDLNRTDRAGRAIGPSLNKVLQPVAGKMDDFKAYWLAKHSDEAIRAGLMSKATRMDVYDVTKTLEHYRQRGDAGLFDQTIQAIQSYRFDLLNELADSGVINRAAMNAWFQKYPSWAPLYRIFEAGGGGASIGKGFVNLPAPIKARTGAGLSRRPIQDPIYSLYKDTITFMLVAERNRVGRALMNLTRFEGSGKYLSHVPMPKRAVRVKLSEVVDSLEQAGIEVTKEQAEALGRVTATFFQPAGPVGKEQIVLVWTGGRPEALQIMDESIYRAITWMDSASASAYSRLLEPAAKVTGVFRAGVVLDPTFWWKNLIRDQLQTGIQSEAGTLPFLDMPRALFHILKRDDLYTEALSTGALAGTMQGLDNRLIRQAMEGMLAGQNPGGARGVVRFLLHPVDGMAAVGEAIEQAPKMAEYIRLTRGGLLRQGAGRLPQTASEAMDAALIARSVNVNFSETGAAFLPKHGSKLSAFWRASLNGNIRFLRAMKENPARTIRRSMAYITMPSVLLYLKNRDDPRYKTAPAWLKNGFWYIGGNVWFPKPFLAGQLFGSSVERMMEWVDSKDPQALASFAKEMLGEVTESLVPDPTTVTAVFELMFNSDWFRTMRGGFQRAPIVPKGEEQLPGRLQYGPTQTETAKGISAFLGRATGGRFEPSPRKVEHAARGFLGGLGQEALRAPDVIRTLLRGELPLATETTGFRGLVRRPYVGSPDVDRFYTELDRLRRTRAGAKQEGRPRRGIPQRMLNAERELRRLRDRREKLLTRKDLPERERAALIDQLNLRIINEARRGLGLPRIQGR